ncbi:DNA-3-methyladenine glycosylase [Tissierella creatinophila]|uniref:Putative 3-methyladenine DNA glycosylase n=1 Tax=Tissierella creatinophila DSM 6911 TaxID=1123403 RepID=A0A1U7M5Q3_TISCR|nr:DNA-3-methyladenine glycosylase [Tissierella creatinophila]OLS02518.1 putative 3-methyladenine DNA glycosylase [Tissierella creatinophila DSM 6911]
MRLKRDFFTRNTELVAKELLGKILVLDRGGQIYKGKIVETEAYTNDNDDAAHFHKGLTDRTRVVREAGGHIYIYNIYGMYQCMNIIAEKEDVLGGVLIRAIEPIEGIEAMYENRYKRKYIDPKKKEIINLTNGPAKLVMSYGITKDEFYGRDLDSDDMIWLEDAEDILEENIVKTPRINIDYAKSKDYLLRFVIKDNPYISKK